MKELNYDTNNIITIIGIVLWEICVLISLYLGFYTIIKVRKHRDKEEVSDLQQKNILSWGIAYILIGITVFLFTLWYFFLESSIIYAFIDSMSVLIFHIAVLIKIFDTEYTLNKHELYRGYYFSIIIVILTIFTLIITPIGIRSNFLYQIGYLSLFISGVSIYIVSFLYAAIKTNGKERSMAIRLLIFPFLVIFSIILMPYNLEVYAGDLSNTPLLYNALCLTPQIIMAIGIILMFSSYKDNLKQLKTRSFN